MGSLLIKQKAKTITLFPLFKGFNSLTPYHSCVYGNEVCGEQHKSLPPLILHSLVAQLARASVFEAENLGAIPNEAALMELLWIHTFIMTHQRHHKRHHRPIGRVIMDWLSHFLGYDEGMIELNCGQHEIEIETYCTPIKVWISFEENDSGLPVCMGNVDKAGAEIIYGGFILYTDIVSTSRKIQWFANLS